MRESAAASAATNTAVHETNLSLLHRFREGETEGERSSALEALTEQNMGLVRSVAYRYRDRLPGGVDFEDLLQIGVMGMLKAAKSFDFTYETTFSTYAVPLIVGEIRRFLRDDGSIKVSRDIRRRGYHVLRAKQLFSEREGREPTVSELAKESGEPTEELAFLLDAASPLYSLSEPLGVSEEEDGFTFEMLLGESENDIDRLTDSLSLRQAIETLPVTDRMILSLRYKKGLSQQQTAKILGLTQVKISRSEKKIFEHLRAILG